jgi:hypothetical protein
MDTIKIETKEQLEEAVATYEDMMAELQPLLWQRDELYKQIETAVVELGVTVISDQFIYQCFVGKNIDHPEAVRLAGIPQSEIDEKTTVTIKFKKSQVDDEWLSDVEKAGGKVTESTSWSSIKTPKAIKDTVTYDGEAKMKVKAK